MKYVIVTVGVIAVGVVVMTMFGVDFYKALQHRDAPYLIGGLIMLVVLPAIAVMFVNSRKIEVEQEFTYDNKYDVMRERTDKMLYEREEDVDQFIAGDRLPQGLDQVPEVAPTGPLMPFSQPAPITGQHPPITGQHPPITGQHPPVAAISAFPNPGTPAGGTQYPFDNPGTPSTGILHAGLPNPATPAVGIPGTNLVAPIVADDDEPIFPNEPSQPLVIGSMTDPIETLERSALDPSIEETIQRDALPHLDLDPPTEDPIEVELDAETELSEIDESEIDDMLDDLEF